MKHWIRNLVVLVLALGLLVGGTKWYQSRNGAADEAFRTVGIARGDIVSTIGATGTLQPEEVINVGAQVAGRIIEFGKDVTGKTVDYGSEIEQGRVLALIDPAVYQSELDSAEAQFAQSKAGVDRAVADAQQFDARFRQAERDWARAQKLGPSDALAQADYDNYQSAFEAAKANVAVGAAQVEQAKRAVAQAQAQVDRAKRNLAFCTIVSPVKGVIIDRRVNIGQTVVASLNAPSLFLIAKDLRRMQVWVAVNEADIGSIRAGQPVTFTVDAFPGRTFKGEVRKVRLNAAMTSNVVTYTVEVTTDNASNVLLPYLTANVHFEVARRDDVLTVPNGALRFTPTDEQIAPDARTAAVAQAPEVGRERSGAGGGERRSSGGGGGGERSGGRRGGGGGGGARGGATTGPIGEQQQPQWRDATLWVRDGKFVRPIEVRAGLSDGAATEVTGDELKDGMEVVVGVIQNGNNSSGAATSTNPFQPRFGGSGGSRGGGGRGPRL